MSTLVVRAPHATKPRLPPRGFARVASVLSVVLDVIVEAQHQAYIAKQRYPFTDW